MSILLGIAVVVFAIGVIGLVVWLLIGDDPPAFQQNPPITDGQARDLLFRAPAWRKGRPNLQPNLPQYNRPLDVNQIPVDEVLPPPREVQGLNGAE